MKPDQSCRTKKFKATFLHSLLFVSVTLLLFSCGKKDKWVDVDPAFSKYIDAYTTGTVSKTSAIRIKLAEDANTTHAVGEAVKEDLFNISPTVKGKAYWLDARTIEFKPDSWLSPDQMYQVAFKLGKVTKTPDKFSDFKFSMKTVKPSFKVGNDGLRATGVKNKMTLSGELETADIEDGKQVEKLLIASQNNPQGAVHNNLKINWQHNDATKTHRYTIENINRPKSATNVDLRWDGKPMNMDVQGEESVAVPVEGDFKVLNVMAVNDAQQFASVQFSDMIAVGQDLTGLISISGQSEISFTINGSEVK
ncbi:MAG: hypothetical protein WAR80_03175, partial [Ferruginibacter sp.]